MKVRFTSLLTAGMALLCNASAFAGNLVLKADLWMPYNGDGQSETGYLIDIAKAVFEPKGTTIVYSLTPWDRAIAEGRKGKCDAIVGAGRDESPDFVFPDEEQGISVQMFCVNKGTTWRYTGIPSLKGLKLGVVKGYTYFKELDAYIGTHPSEIIFGSGKNPLQVNLHRLLKGEVSTVVDDHFVLAYTISKMGLRGKVLFAGTNCEATQPSKIYIAFSPANPKSAEYAKTLSDGMVALRQSGELQKILAKYGLTDWK